MTDAKHEAPAEGAGGMDDDDASTYAPSVAGLSDYLWNQAQAADSMEGRCILEMWREAVDALRARSSREGEAVRRQRCTRCDRGEVFGMSDDSGFWVEFSSVAGGANEHGMNGWLELVEHWPDGRDVRREYIAKDSPLYAAPSADKLLDALRDQSWGLRCFNIPTGGDDFDIGWRVIGHWQAEPRERTIAEVFTDDPAEAVRQALAALKAGGAK